MYAAHAPQRTKCTKYRLTSAACIYQQLGGIVRGCFSEPLSSEHTKYVERTLHTLSNNKYTQLLQYPVTQNRRVRYDEIQIGTISLFNFVIHYIGHKYGNRGK